MATLVDTEATSRHAPRPRTILQPLILKRIHFSLVQLFGFTDDPSRNLSRDDVKSALVSHGLSPTLDASSLAEQVLLFLRPYTFDFNEKHVTLSQLTRFMLSPLPYPQGLSFVQVFLEHVVSSHRALQHPYLQRLSTGRFPNTRLAILDFARNYAIYNQTFIGNVEIAIAKLRSTEHKNALQKDLKEEQGIIESEEDRATLQSAGFNLDHIDGISHKDLFNRFVSAIEEDMQSKSDSVPSDMSCKPGATFAEHVSAFIRHKGNSEASCVGALSIGTEAVVKIIYQYITKGIELAFPDLRTDDYVFFPLHVVVDDTHAGTLLSIASDVVLRLSPTGTGSHHDLINGALTVLDARLRLWDDLLARAEKMVPESSAGEQQLQEYKVPNGNNINHNTPKLSASTMYNKQATNWVRKAPSCLSDFTARPTLAKLVDSNGKNVLDIGCGEGYFARLLRQQFGATSVIGVDVSPQMITAAQTEEAMNPIGGLHYAVSDAVHLVNSVRTMSLSALPEVVYEDDIFASFDRAVASFVFNYMSCEDMTSVMKQVYKLLKPGGLFAFSVPHPCLAFWQASSDGQREQTFSFETVTKGYFEGRNAVADGHILTKDRRKLNVRMVHKTFQDYFAALKEAGFKTMPTVAELGVTDGLLELNKPFFGPLNGVPLHVAVTIKKEETVDNVKRSAVLNQNWVSGNPPSVDDISISCPLKVARELQNVAQKVLRKGFVPENMCVADIPTDELQKSKNFAKELRGLLVGDEENHRKVAYGAVLLKGLFDDVKKNAEMKDSIDESVLMKTMYFILSSLMGDVDRHRGALWDVVDKGLDVKQDNVLFSVTHHQAGFHTDGSLREYFPDIVGLLCLQPYEAADVNESVDENNCGALTVANGYAAYSKLKGRLPSDIVAQLRRGNINHDRISSGLGVHGEDGTKMLEKCKTREEIMKEMRSLCIDGDKELRKLMIEDNVFPIFDVDEQTQTVRMRYMRDWIESGYEKCGVAIPKGLTQAMDALDKELRDGPQIKRKLERGEVMWTNNHCVAHSRDAFPAGSKRHMVRVWISVDF